MKLMSMVCDTQKTACAVDCHDGSAFWDNNILEREIETMKKKLLKNQRNYQN